MDLQFDKVLYCDQGPNSGKQFVRLHGHLTAEELALLKELIASGTAL